MKTETRYIVLIGLLLAFLLTAFVVFVLPAEAQVNNSFSVAGFVKAGPTVGARTTAAQASCNPNASLPCYIVFDTMLYFSPVGTMPAKCAQCIWLDYTGKFGGIGGSAFSVSTIDAWGTPDAGQHVPYNLNNSSTTSSGWAGYGTQHLYFEAIKGGHNDWNGSTGSKANYYAFTTSTVARTPGQIMSNELETNNFSSGDTVSLATGLRRWGGTLTNGDEGIEVVRLDAGTGDALFTATVATSVAGVITFTGASNAATLGETRMLVNRSRNTHTAASCTVSAAIPPVVTCAGASLTSWYSSGAQSNVCFELSSAKVDEFNRTIPVRSIANDTQAVLSLRYQGNDYVWDGGGVGVPTSGAGVFTRCSAVTDASLWAANKVSVSDGSIFAANDSIELGVAPEQGFTGLGLLYYPSVWPATRTAALAITNAGSKNGGTPTVPLTTYIHTGGSATGRVGGEYLWDHWNGTVIKGGTYWHNESATPPTGPWFFAWSNNTTGCEQMLGTYRSDGVRWDGSSVISYCRHATDANSRGWRFANIGINESGEMILAGGGYNGGNPSQWQRLEVVATGSEAGISIVNGTTTGKALVTPSYDVDMSGNERVMSGASGKYYSDAGSTLKAQINGATGAISSALGADNKAVCWKAAAGGVRALGYCSTVVDAAGACTCN